MTSQEAAEIEAKSGALNSPHSNRKATPVNWPVWAQGCSFLAIRSF
jgi:hypothetical protein